MRSQPREFSVVPVPCRDEIVPGDDLVDKLREALRQRKLSFRAGDILVIKHKVVAKAEGRVVRLDTVKPSSGAKAWSRQCGVDARLVELALAESQRVVRKKMLGKRGVLITETRSGFICANSGVDVSNVDGGQTAVLLPRDSDASARRLRSDIKKRFGVVVAIIITDSFGRAWREGLTEVAIGIAGMKPLIDYRGLRDRHGYVIHASEEAVADELACAAGLVCGKLNSTPFCIVRGFRYQPGHGSARELIRAPQNDLFR